MNRSTARQGPALNPITHFILLPLLLVSLAFAIYFTAHSWHDNPVVYPWLIVISCALLLLNTQSRLYALRLQDRVIRLEESLRISALCPETGSASLSQLTTSQLIGLRFASDAELPELAGRAVRERLTQAQIKDAIREWRTDNARV